MTEGSAVLPNILVTGSNGKLGRVLRACWPAQLAGQAHPVWQVRSAPGAGDLVWTIGKDRYVGPSLKGGVVLHLAGGRQDLAANVPLAIAVCEAAAVCGAKHVFLASSSAVYAADETADLTETSPAAPGSDYGRAKLAMEGAVAEWVASAGPDAPGVTVLRIGNVLGCDSLMGSVRPGEPMILTPVPGRNGGPMRSYIGPASFAEVLARLCRKAVCEEPLPAVLNIGAAPAVQMADLLTAAGAEWSYGPPTDDVQARVVLGVDRLRGLIDMPALDAADPAMMVAEWRAIRGQTR